MTQDTFEWAVVVALWVIAFFVALAALRR